MGSENQVGENVEGRSVLLARVLALAALYFVLGYVGLQLAYFHQNATLVWAPSGLALAALILYGVRLWPGVFLGAFALSLTTLDSWLPRLVIPLGNTLEAVVGTLLLVRLADFHPSLERVRDVNAFLAIGVFGCTMVSATVGVSMLAVSGGVSAADFPVVWLTWWLGDAGGALIVAPLLLLGRHGSPTWRSLVSRPESWVVLGLAIVVSTVSFGGMTSGTWMFLAALLPFYFLVWAGSRLGPRGAVTLALVISVAAIVGTAAGAGPFVVEGMHETMLLLWAYCVTIGMTGLTLAAAISQREQAERLYRSGEEGRLRLERRMHEAQRLEALGLLAGGVAHDVNNVLTVIRGNAMLLGEKLAGDAPGQARVRKIDAAAGRAADFCQRLLSYAGREQPSTEAVLLQEVIGETNALVRTFISAKVRVETSSAADTPAVEGDPTQIQQVMMNLVLNAAEAIGDRPGSIVIRAGRAKLSAADLVELANASSASPGSFGFVEVRDTGSGMAFQTLERIFDPFFSTKREARGLGLASVLGIVRGHAGAITVGSEPGHGSWFKVYFPESVGEASQPRERAATTAGGGGRGQLILVAEDEPEVLELVVHVLESAGYRTLPVSDGRKAYECFRERSDEIDAVLLDVSMPALSGAEVRTAIGAFNSRVPVILMSGYDPSSVSGGAGPDGFLRKPFSNEELVEEVGRALQSWVGRA